MRVVCPVCRSGFEASVTKDNCALNCVSCGVAFSAAHYLNKDSAAKEPQIENSSTRTRGLPFMNETGTTSSRALREEPKLAAQPLSSSTPNGGSGGGAGTSRSASAEAQAPRVAALRISKTGQPQPQRMPETVNLAVPGAGASAARAAVAVAEMTTSTMNLEKAETEKKKKTTRRPLLEGQFGPYEIEGEIARGGVGAVFRARERATGKTVALKVLLEGDEAAESERERFRHECETAKALSLPGMVQVFHVGELDNRPYMAMELVNGRSLDKIIPDKSLSVNDCLVLTKAVAETIGALHEAGYVHRDLKPGNILIDAFGSPKVADFGLVKSLDEITRLTASGLVCGTPAYMAPEQARGDGNAVDPRSDVWALGAVLYEMLACEPAFKAENALRLMLKITRDQPKPLRALNIKVPQDVQNIVAKCLEKNPARRYPNARALAQEIGRFLNGEQLEASAQPTVQRLLAVASEHSRTLATLGGMVAAIVVVAVIVRLVFAPRAAAPAVERGYLALNDSSLKDGERLDQAEKLFREALSVDNKQAKAHLGLGLCLGRRAINPLTWKIADQKKAAEAVAETARAAELDPALQADCHAQIAKFNYWMKEYAGEASEWEHAVAAAPANLKYREALGIAYWNAGAQSKAPRYYESAIREFQTILKAQPEYPKVREYIKLLQDRYLVQSGSAVSQAATPRR